MLQIVDQQWKDHLYSLDHLKEGIETVEMVLPLLKDHLYSLDHLKEGIGLRGYGQRDPLVEYKKESFELFQAMKDRVDEDIVRYLWWLRPMPAEEAHVARRPAPRRVASFSMNH